MKKDLDIEIIEPYIEVLFPITKQQGQMMVELIERAGRTCYKSEEKITGDSCKKFIKMIIDRGHLSVLEHSFATVRWVGSRTMSHQLVRHRLMAISQESQRFCDYSKKGDKKLKVIMPSSFKEINFTYEDFYDMNYNLYKRLIEEDGIKPQDARFVLTNSTKTELVTTANFREWRHIFNMRCDKHAQWEIRYLAIKILEKFQTLIPCVFDDFVIHSAGGTFSDDLYLREKRSD